MLTKQISEFIENLDIKNLEERFIPGKTFIPASAKKIDKTEIKLMVEASIESWLTTGKFNEQFEKKLANFIGIKHLITVNSGSSANLVAFSTLTSSELGERAIKRGDEVISVAAGFPTTINPILQFGAIPVFIDIDRKTLNIQVDLIEQAITKRTKAIFIAHTLGLPFDLDKIKSICEKHNLWLIEDCCDALGSLYSEKYVGTFGDISTLSFYPAHHITMGEGGAVFTNNSHLKKIAESFRDWGRDCYCPPGKENTCGKRYEWQKGSLPYGYDHKYIFSHRGYNLKISDMQAACGLGQLDKLESFIEARKKNFNYLYQKLMPCFDEIYIPMPNEKSSPSWFGFPIIINSNASFSRYDLVTYLNQNNIGTRLLFAGNVTKQPYMQSENFRVFKDLKDTDFIMNNMFWIGVHPKLNKLMMDYMAEKIIEFIRFE